MAASDWISIASIIVSAVVGLLSIAVGHHMFKEEQNERRLRDQTSSDSEQVDAGANKPDQSDDTQRQIWALVRFFWVAIVGLVKFVVSDLMRSSEARPHSGQSPDSGGGSRKAQVLEPPDEEPGAQGQARSRGDKERTRDNSNVERRSPADGRGDRRRSASELSSGESLHEIPTTSPGESTDPDNITVGPRQSFGSTKPAPASGVPSERSQHSEVHEPTRGDETDQRGTRGNDGGRPGPAPPGSSRD